MVRTISIFVLHPEICDGGDAAPRRCVVFADHSRSAHTARAATRLLGGGESNNSRRHNQLKAERQERGGRQGHSHHARCQPHTEARPRQAAAVPAAPALRLVPTPVRHYFLNLALPPACARAGAQRRARARARAREGRLRFPRHGREGLQGRRVSAARSDQQGAHGPARVARPSLNRGRSAVTSTGGSAALSLCGCVLFCCKACVCAPLLCPYGI